MITIGFVHFRTTCLAHLDAAWFTLSRQTSWTGVESVFLLDNNTDDSAEDILRVTSRYHLPVPVQFVSAKHGDLSRTQSWSVNEVWRAVSTPWVFFTRTDFLLNYDCLEQLVALRDSKGVGWNGFCTSYCHQMGCDAQLSNADVLAPHSQPEALWRHDPHGPQSLFGHVPANLFTSTGVDAGVWLAHRDAWVRTNGLNERMVSWGFQQQEWQRLMVKAGIEICVIPAYLFHHQHHYAPRDFAMAAHENRFAR